MSGQKMSAPYCTPGSCGRLGPKVTCGRQSWVVWMFSKCGCPSFRICVGANTKPTPKPNETKKFKQMGDPRSPQPVRATAPFLVTVRCPLDGFAWGVPRATRASTRTSHRHGVPVVPHSECRVTPPGGLCCHLQMRPTYLGGVGGPAKRGNSKKNF